MGINQQANALFSQFTKKLAKVDLRLAVAVPAVIGAVTAMYGIGMEFHGQQELLRQGGVAALDAYNAAMQANPIDSVSEYTRLAFKGELPSFGGNTQGIGISTAYIGPIVASAAVTLARGFDRAKSFLTEKAVQLTNRPKLDDRVPVGSTFTGGSLIMASIGVSTPKPAAEDADEAQYSSRPRC